MTDFGLSVRFKPNNPAEEGQTAEQAGGANGEDTVSATFGQSEMGGTPSYMSPEMASGRWSDVSTASDIYGLGAVLYSMLTGKPPFRGKDRQETLRLVVEGKLVSPRELNPGVDRELNAVCLKCLDREPGRRYQSADALANDLRRWLDRRPTLAGGKPSVVRELRFWLRRHPLGLALTAVATALLWLAGLGVSMANLRAENKRESERLASQVNRELRLICRATQILATDQRLRASFDAFPAPERARPRQIAIETFLATAVDRENLFGIAGGNPLVNIFILDRDGVLLADTLPDSQSIGKHYQVRDYYRTLVQEGWPPDRPYVARSFLSTKDNLFKIAVSTQIWRADGNLLGILVANFTIGPRLIDVDLRDEPNAIVLCPMDRSDPVREVEDRDKSWRYIGVLDSRYAVEGEHQPLTLDQSVLPDFQGTPALAHATAGPWGGKLVDYHRVGETSMVVVMTRRCPWPLSWLPGIR